MESIKISIISFLIIYLLYLLTVVLNKRKREKFLETSQASIIINKYKLDKKKIDVIKFSNIIALSNSFTIALTLGISELIDNYILKLIVSFIVIIILILIMYTLIGRSYQKKGSNKNV